MRNGIIILAALAVGGIALAASPPASTQPSGCGSCCGMNMSSMKMDMSGGMKCMMGGMAAPTTQPAAVTPDEHAAHHSQ